jgi:regulator of sigma D
MEPADLSEALSRLGEHLAERIELEDRIVAAIRQSDIRMAA